MEPYIMGEKHPLGNRIANVQKSIRTIDIEEVGDTTHHTFFEMLGNWSFGDYFKEEAIQFSWEFLTAPEWLGLDKNRLAVSVFKGDDNAAFDKVAFDMWKKVGVPEARIARLGEDNWWGPAAETGPCGPSSEMFYWVGDLKEVPDSFNDDDDRWVEIWNDVFMEFNKKADGSFEKLAQQNVDTGMGMERVIPALNGLDDNYRIDVFWPLIEKIQELSGKNYDNSQETKRSMRIVADHLKAAVIMIGDGVAPSNTERGYILRRLIRRAIRQGKSLGIEKDFTVAVAKVVQDLYREVYPETANEKVLEELQAEETKFRKTLDRALKVFSRETLSEFKAGETLIGKLEKQYSVGDEKRVSPPSKLNVTGEWLFKFYQELGFPFEMAIEELEGMGVDYSEKDIAKLKKEFQVALEKHQAQSRTASAGMFKGGLADTQEETKKLHTVAHLLLAGLRKVLGEHVHQKGSNINGERVRFDFSHDAKMTDEEKKQVEDFVNQAIEKDLPVSCEQMNLEEAKKSGAEGAFESKYGEEVKVYEIPGFSKEICGGPHVESTGVIGGKFRIKKEQSSSAGVRRIKGVIES